MVAFRTAVDALDFAIAFHADIGEPRIRIRTGVHVGPVRIIENDMYGMMVNYTKRVESSDNAQWIVLSDEAKKHIDYEKAVRHANLRFELIMAEFKGFTKRQKIWRVMYPEMGQRLREKLRAARQVMSNEPRPQPLSPLTSNFQSGELSKSYDATSEI
jgi:class 3 adenylate cyclase